ncbi:hypothetical protein CPB86DRAFT_258759 [Serendipita vermifera]|nr:hypothetical protein CPB86DRAFT_258759 [Serendipita vermifera]
MYLPRIACFLAYFSFSQAATTIIAYIGDPNVQASGSWTIANTCGNNTNAIGDSVELTFTGTSVSFVGTRQVSGGIISFSLDGEQQGTVDINWTASFPTIACNQVLYHSAELTNGKHTLVATLTGASPGRSGAGMAMEYFAYTVPDTTTATGPDATVNSIPTNSNSPQNSPPKKNTVSSGGAAGIFFGGIIGGSALVAIGLFVLPIIRRKALSQGSVTGKVESGLYRILNDRHLNVAGASDANDISPITGISYGRIPDHKWDITLQANGRYLIQNHAHATVYAGWSSTPRPQLGDDIVNTPKSDIEWRIEETKEGSRKYRIFTIGDDEKDVLCWTLTYDNPRTPITLLKSNGDTSQLWTLCLLETHNP